MGSAWSDWAAASGFKRKIVGDDINKPLGRARKPDAKPESGQSGLSAGRLFASLAIAGVIIGATWIAVSGARIESGETAVLMQPETAATDAQIPDDASGETADQQQPAAAAVESDTLPALSGRSGADITTTLTDDGQEVLKLTPAQRETDGPVLLKVPGRVGQNPRIAHLPDPAIVESTGAGSLPIRGVDGERAIDIYARPWSGARGARVAIIVGGLGLSQTGSQHAIRTLPPEITLGFAANGNSLQRWMQEARREGHEILLQIPFEPFDYPANDPGPGTLTVAAGAERNLADLHQAMARITNYTGITNFMGGRFLSDPEALEPIMRDIARRGIMFVDDGTSAQSLVDQFAKTLGIPFAASDMVLDARQERGYILGKLDDLERTARRNGAAVGVASAFEVSVDAIAAWANEAKARGIEIVSISAVADDPEK